MCFNVILKKTEGNPIPSQKPNQVRISNSEQRWFLETATTDERNVKFQIERALVLRSNENTAQKSTLQLPAHHSFSKTDMDLIQTKTLGKFDGVFFTTNIVRTHLFFT